MTKKSFDTIPNYNTVEERISYVEGYREGYKEGLQKATDLVKLIKDNIDKKPRTSNPKAQSQS